MVDDKWSGLLLCEFEIMLCVSFSCILGFVDEVEEDEDDMLTTVWLTVVEPLKPEVVVVVLRRGRNR